MKTYQVRFAGTQQAVEINARSAKEAKEVFARKNGVTVSSYIVASKGIPLRNMRDLDAVMGW